MLSGGEAPEEEADAIEDALRCLIRPWGADVLSAQEFGDLGVLVVQAVTAGQQRRSLALHHIPQHKGVHEASLRIPRGNSASQMPELASLSVCHHSKSRLLHSKLDARTL